MQNNELQQKWPAIKARIISEYPEIKEQDLNYDLAQESELLLKLQEKLGKNKKEMDNWLSMMG